MGTGSGIFDEQMMTRGRCPHCNVTVKFEWASPLQGAQNHVSFSIGDPLTEHMNDGETPWRTFRSLQCPNCWDIVVWMR